MKLVIRTHQLEAPADVLAFLQKHVVTPLRRLHDSPATQLTVCLEDAMPERGGVDQACKMTFRMPGARSLRVESVTHDVHASLLDCAQRLRRLVQRQVDRQRSNGRTRASKPLGRVWREVSTRRVLAPDGTPSTL
ncbi:MAG TPA: HPF/RaiA family ribosome-associated protein [Anaeromyxobacteraceae bacterium]|nr:HPF/RaiA family ribosome-associated protein [Anaeromyxobacteraceae bacterium]